MAQTNHFMHPDMVERAFDASDGHFTPTFGKWLETRARMGLVNGYLAEAVPAKAADTDWAIECLASHEDWELKRASSANGHDASWVRSFGRTPSRAYGQLSSIVRGDPDRSRKRDEVWMTLGERRPASHSTMLGWQVDWTDLAVTPVADRHLRRAAHTTSVRPNWEDGLHHYVEACIAATRPRTPDGAFLNRDPNKAELLRDFRLALQHLDRAIELALADGIEEIPFRYMRARIRHSAEDYAASHEDWAVLLDIWDAQKSGRRPSCAGQPTHMHRYEAALIHMLSVATEDRLRGGMDWPERANRLAEAGDLLKAVRAEHFPQDRPVHHDLRAWEERLAKIREDGGGKAELPEDNFITVE
jgi:hypothetical protein